MPPSDPFSNGTTATIDGIPISDLPPSPTRSPTTAQEISSSKRPRPNMWKILRDAVGKDLTRLTLPVYFNEPLSFLQRVTEDVEYHTLLTRAASPTLAHTADRAALVAAFLVSHYASTAERTSKPFNPLLGETYDVVLPNEGVAIVCEQVSHHPPVTAMHAVGPGWSYAVAYEVRSKFHANTLEAWPEGRVHVHFDDGGHFSYEQAHTYVNNLVMGSSLSIDNAGRLTVRDEGDGRFDTTLKMRKGGRKHGGGIVGEVRDNRQAGGKAVRTLSGNWWDMVRIDGKEVWSAGRRALREETGGYQMTTWAWQRNAPPNCEGDGAGGGDVASATIGRVVLPKTDSRLRPDVRAWERGEYDRAAAEKERLEKGQRERRKKAEENGACDAEAGAKWFDKVDGDGDHLRWRYRGAYFETKMAVANGADWPEDGPDIF